MYLFKKPYLLTCASILALTFSLLKPSYPLEETWESRALVARGFGISAVQAVELQQQAMLATAALNGSASADTVNTLPMAIFFLNAALDGIHGVSNLTSFTVTTPATNMGGTISMVGNDGTPGQMYSVVYSSPIAPNGTMILTHGNRSIIFVNNSGFSITSAGELATYLAGAHPLNFLISNTASSKIAAVSRLLGGADGGLSGTNTSLYGRAMTAASAIPVNRMINILLDGVQSVSGLTRFTVTTPATNAGGTVSIVGNDGTPGRTYFIDATNIGDGSGGTVPILADDTFILTHTGSGNTVTFVNSSGAAITSAAALAAYLASAFPLNFAISDTTVNKATALRTALGGANSAMGRAMALGASLVLNPSGVLTTDIEILAGALVSAPSGVLETDLRTLNSLLDGVAAGSTTQSRIVTLFGSIDGSDGSAGDIISKLNAQIIAIEPGAVQLSTAIGTIKAAVGSNGDTLDRVYKANALLDGVQKLSGLTRFTVTTPATNAGGTISIIGNDGAAGRTYSIDATNIGDGSGGTTPIPAGATFTLTHAGSGNTVTFVNNSGAAITSAPALAAYLASSYPLNSVISNTTVNKATALRTILGGVNSSTMGQAMALGTNLVLDPSGVLATDIATLATALVSVPSGVLATDISALAGKLVPAPSGVLETDLDTLSTALLNNTNFGSPLTNQVTALSSSLDNGLSSLPPSGTYATIGTVATIDGVGGVNIVISAGLGGGANGTYNLPAATIMGGIANGSTFTLTNGGNNLVLYNRSGVTISTQAAAIRYLAGMYPQSSQIATGVSDKITNGLNKLVGGAASSVRARIAAVDASLLTQPTGVLATDLQTVNNLLGGAGSTTQARVGAVNSLINGIADGSTTQARIEAVNSLLDGVAAGSTAEARIGSPNVNGVASNLGTVIGGPEASIAGQLGDPVGAATGLSSLIDASAAINNNGVFTGGAIDALTGAANLYSQMQAFLALLNPDNWANPGTTITFDLSGGAPASLADLISKASGTA